CLVSLQLPALSRSPAARRSSYPLLCYFTYPPRTACDALSLHDALPISGHRDDLVQDPAPLLLRGLHVRLGVPGRDLGTRPHRQPIIHVPGCTPTPPVSRALLGEAPTHFRGHFR